MTGILVLTGMGILFAIVVVAINHSKKYRQKIADSLNAAAARMNGEVVDGGFWKGKYLRFRVDGVKGRMNWFSGTDKAPPWRSEAWEIPLRWPI